MDQYLMPINMDQCAIKFVVLTHLCPGEDYWADFYNFLHNEVTQHLLNVGYSVSNPLHIDLHRSALSIDPLCPVLNVQMVIMHFDNYKLSKMLKTVT